MMKAICKQKKILAAAAAAVLLLAAAAFWYAASHVFVDGTAYDKKARQLDLRGQQISVSHYETLRQLLPECEIAWDVPFQGQYLPEDTRQITVTSLTDEDVAVLAYLPRLEQIRAEGCGDYPQLLALAQQHPQAEVTYFVTLGNRSCPQDTRELRFESEEPEGEQLLERLRYLPELTSVHFVQPVTDPGILRQLREVYPDVTVTWEKDVLGQTLSDSVTELDFSETPPGSVEEMERLLAYFPELEKVYFGRCMLDNEELAAYRDRVRQDYKVAWEVDCGRFSIRTDAESMMSYKYNLFSIYDEELENFKYCEDMICVDLGHNYLRSCDWAAYMPNLKYLILAHNNYLTDISGLSNCENLVYLEIGWTALRDISPLLGCTALEDINMKYVYCDADTIVQMPWLKHVFWAGCPSRNYEMLEQACADTYLLLEEEGWDTKHWRQLDNYYAQRDVLGMYYMY